MLRFSCRRAQRGAIATCATLLQRPYHYKIGHLDEVKELRHRTAAPIGECVKALNESNGNLDEAIEILKKSGQAKALKVGTRETTFGAFVTVVCPTLGACVVQVASETDFAARNSTFLAAVDKIRELSIDSFDKSKGELFKAHNVDLLKHVQFLSVSTLTSCIGVMGENITVKNVWKVMPPELPLFRDITTEFVNFRFGAYSHNSMPGFPCVGNTVAIACLVTKATPPAIPLTDADVNDLAQHVVSHGGDTDRITHQQFLGSQDTVGRWLNQHEARFGSALNITALWAALNPNMLPKS